MRTLRGLLAVAAVAGLPLLAGCSSDDHDHYRSSRTYDRDYRATRSNDPYGYDSARQAGYGSNGTWRDAEGNLHHPPGWKAASDRGRLSNDRDDRGAYDRTYDRYYDRY